MYTIVFGKTIANIGKHCGIDINIIVISEINSRHLKGCFIFTIKGLTWIET